MFYHFFKPQQSQATSGTSSPVAPHLPLLLVLLFFTVLTLYNSATLPLGEADDETDHYQYLRFVARTGYPPLTEAERNEAGFKGGLAPLYYWLTAWPIAIVGEQTLPDIRRVDAKPERHLPTDGLGINHVLHTLDEAWPWRGQVLAWHLVRFLSLPLGWITLIAAYALARRLWPESPLIALGTAAFMAFLPRFVLSSAVINDDNLVFALTTLLLLVQVIILQNTLTDKKDWRLYALFGALFGLALITKYFSLILIPEIIFTLWFSLTRNAPQAPIQNQKSRNMPYPSHALLAFLAALILTAGPWFSFIIFRFNRIEELGFIPGLAASLGEPQITEGLVGLLSGHSVRPVAATYSLTGWFSLLYRSFWFEFGWMRIFASPWIYLLFTIFWLLALVGHIRRFWILDCLSDRRGFTITSCFTPHILLLTLHFALFIAVVLARYILSATIDTGQGRHLYPALAVIGLFIATGLNHLRSTTIRYPLSAIPFFLLPAIISLQPSAYILPQYQTLPVTITAPANLPITYRHHLSFAQDLSLAGFEVTPAATAGTVLPVTLYWRAEQEARQDYLVSLCLEDDHNRPAACWRGHFAGGRYPARAWEAGDTLIDRVFIPLPTCANLTEQAYRLHLELWPLRADTPEPQPDITPVWQQTFAEPLVTLHSTDTQQTQPQTVEVWQGDRLLSGPTPISLNNSLTWLSYAQDTPNPLPEFYRQATGDTAIWSPVPGWDTDLFLPCPNGSTPLAHQATFIAGPALLPGLYLPNNSDGHGPEVTLSLSLRDRLFAPLTATLTFSPALSLLSLQLPNTSPLDPTQALPNSNLKLSPGQTLPITLRWQARRWMADPLIVSLKLLDKDYQVAGERLVTLGDRYPNVLWAPTEVVEESYSLPVKADTPPGLYRLEVSLLRQDKTLPNGYEYLPLNQGDLSLGHNLYPLTFRVLDPNEGTPPPHIFAARLGDTIHLAGYDLNQSVIDNCQLSIDNCQLILALYWQTTAPLSTDYTVFTQLIGPDGQVWAQWDNPPQAGRYPTTVWSKQETVIDRYILSLREDAPPGEYRLLAGMYNPTTGQRLPVTVNGQPQPDNAISLTTLTIGN